MRSRLGLWTLLAVALAAPEAAGGGTSERRHAVMALEGLTATGLGVVFLEGMEAEDAWTAPGVAWVHPRPVSRKRWGRKAIVDYTLAPYHPLNVRCEWTVKGRLTRQDVTIIPTAPISRDVAVSLELMRFGDGDYGTALVPRLDGVGEEAPLQGQRWWTWPFDGAGQAIPDAAQQLAIPTVSLTAADGQAVTLAADPWFATSFTCREWGTRKSVQARWAYLGSKVPLREPVTRTFWQVYHDDGWDGAMKAWYSTALADVPEGPDWLHEVAWQHYDYLSHGGKGWFEDIDAVAEIVPRRERKKVVFTLHGWYDVLGRYTFDAKTGKLDDAWTAFPNADAVREKGFNVSESVAVTKEELHRRIRYAKDKGFRVCLYFADGLTACEGAGVFAEDKLLAWGGWQGPDTIGRSYTQNPAHPEVYRWYVEYLKALLGEYGDEIDALVWDETFMIRSGMTAPENAPEPAYLCGAFLRLTKELTQITTAHRRELAFLASDDIGMTNDEAKEFWRDVPPYAMMAHGCYQDSHSRPQVWPYGIFPNLRNTLWSCNWAAVTNFEWTKYGVEQFDTPVATSNGWLDSKGVARLSEAERGAVVALWKERNGRRQELRPLAVDSSQ